MLCANNKGMSNHVRYLSAVIFMLPAAVFAAKHDTQHQDAFTPGNADESKIVREVRHQLVTLPYYGVFDDLAFRVDGDTVTLLGATSNTTLKRDAENAVKHVEGVARVNDQIELLPVSPMDDQIRRSVFRAIYGDPALSTIYGYRSIPPIHIIVKNGNVTLEGVVANQMDKNIANIRANSVSGVFSVTNNLMTDK
jgi:hyperosmotically inducible protein